MLIFNSRKTNYEQNSVCKKYAKNPLPPTTSHYTVTTAHHGFTLIELLTVCAILCIILSVGMPAFSQLMASVRAQNLYNQLFTLLHYTRSTAAFSATDTLLCPSKDQIHCTKDWQHPIMVFSDTNDNQQRDHDEIIHQYIKILKNGEAIFWRSFGNRPYIRYISNGSTQYQSGNITICSKQKTLSTIKKIIIYRSGRSRKALKKEIKISNCR